MPRVRSAGGGAGRGSLGGRRDRVDVGLWVAGQARAVAARCLLYVGCPVSVRLYRFGVAAAASAWGCSAWKGRDPVRVLMTRGCAIRLVIGRKAGLRNSGPYRVRVGAVV